MKKKSIIIEPILENEYLNKILTGDCLEIMRKMPDISIDLAITTPPYILKNSSGNGMSVNTKTGKWAGKSMDRKLIKIFFVLIILFSECNKSNDNVPSGIYLKRIIYHQNVDQINILHYNKNGLLSTKEGLFGNKITGKLEYQYNNLMLSRINFYELAANQSGALISERYIQFEYQNNLIIKSTLFPDNYVVNYEYDNNKRIIKQLNPESARTFEYDARGNIIKETFSYSGTVSTTIRIYDDKINPFYKVDVLNQMSGFIGVVSYYCPNNIKKQIYMSNADTTNIFVNQYEYNKYNLPESMNSVKYEYETK